MTSEEKKRWPNSGVFGPNQKKLSANHPDFTGSCNVGGIEYYHSVWTKRDKQGNVFYTDSFRPKDEHQQPTAPSTGYTRAAEPQQAVPFDDDSIPF